MQSGVRRAYIVLGIIGVIEVLALGVLLVAPSPKEPPSLDSGSGVSTSTIGF